MMILGLLLLFTLLVNQNRGHDCSLATIQSVSNCNEVDISYYEYDNVGQTDWEGLAITALYAAGTMHPGPFLAGLVWKTLRDAVAAKETQALNEAFQDKINAEFNRLQRCIDDKIENRFHYQAQKDLYEFIDTFEELKDHSEADFSDKYMHLVDSVRNFVGSTFNANVDTLLTYKSYLPVFRATVNFYNGLIIGYLFYLKDKCASITDDQQLFCDRLSTYTNLGLKDAGDLLNWAQNARDYIEQSYIPSITKNNYDNGCRVSDYVVVQSGGGQFIYHDYRAIAMIVWGKEDIMYAIPDKVDMYSPDHLSAYLNIITPEVSIVCDISGTIECPTYDYRPHGVIGDHVETPKQECCDNMGQIGTNQFNTILTQINNWHTEFNLKFIQPIDDLINMYKLFNIETPKGVCGELLLAQQKDATQYTFSSNTRNTGLENVVNPEANTYMIIGAITESLYKLQDQKYLFRLDYVLMDGVSKVSLTWKQSSWLTETSITGYEAIDIPPEPNAGSSSDFEGLGKSSDACTYIDGDGYKHNHWFNSVGSNCQWRGGTPGFDEQVAKSMALYIYSPIGCTNIATDECGELLLAEQKDATQYSFSPNARNTGLENAGNPGANTYMIIGEITGPSFYKLQDQKYLFRLDYVLMDGVSKVSLTWKQSSWLTETSITGYEAIDIPPEPNAGSSSDFEGLGKSSDACTYIDGDGYKHNHWFNSVGSNCQWGGGTPGFDEQAAKSMALYIYSPIGCTNIAGDSQGEILLARHQDATESLFSTDSRNTGIENEYQPEANTYMIIGKISDPTIYKLNDNKYLFHLQYVTKDHNKLYNLKWKQLSWLTEASIQGYEAIDMPPEPNADSNSDFEGLGKSSTSCTYLDGDAHQSGYWFNAVGTNQNCNGWGGASPGYNREAVVYTALYMYNPTTWKAYTVQPPILEYNFDDLHESISGGDSNYDLILSGQVKIENGELVCDGSGNAVSTGLIDENTKPFNSHSFEVAVKLDDLNQQGAGVIAIDSDYGSPGYVHYRFDSLVFNEYNNDKKWISGSEYSERTNTPITNAPQEDSSIINDYVHFVVTYNDVDRYVQLYRNGAKYGYASTPSDFLINDFRGYKIMFCQRHKDSSKDKLRGRISFGAVYDYPLSSQQVFELYKNF